MAIDAIFEINCRKKTKQVAKLLCYKCRRKPVDGSKESAK
jgi:hypothetical protein